MVELPRTLLKDFAEVSTGVIKEGTNAKYVRGTVKVVGEKKYVLIDGASTTTPIAEVVDVDEGDRVLVSIQNHTATILGNFTFPPSARKEHEAIDKAEDAQQNANQANENMNAAFEAAQSAKDNADQAMADATEASSIAANAKKEAADALLYAQEAASNLGEAQQAAVTAAEAADSAKKDAAAAQAAVADAQEEFDKINQDITTVKSDVQGALTQVGQQASEMETIKSTLQTDYAKKTEVSEVEASLSSEITQKVGELQATVQQNYAGKTDLTALEGKLQTQITQNAEGLTSQATKIEKIESDTTEAKKDVDEALEKAGLAQTAASAAQTAASAAQTAADEAKANASTADSKAQAAQTAADAAQAKAEAADKAVQTAQSDLDEAKKNLTSVTSRVDATEEEIAEAQQKVDEAQTAVNTALADAAEANLAAANATAAANQAKQDAATAQQVASTAQSKADNAQAAADKAQEDADQALKDVAALTSRVTAAETSITQNAEKIELAASKTEEIGTKLDNMEIGGRNLLRYTGELNKIYFVLRGDATAELTHGLEVEEWGCDNGMRVVGTVGTERLFSVLGASTHNPSVNDRNYVGTCYVKNMHSTERLRLSLNWLETDGQHWIEPGESKRVVILATGNGANNLQFNIFTEAAGDQFDFIVWHPKIEEGTVPTDWTPAPEDIETELENNYYNKTETDAKIKVEADKISSTVKTTVTEEISKVEIGGRNLALNSDVVFSGTEYLCAGAYGISPSEGNELSDGRGQLVEGERYYVSICITPPADMDYASLFLSAGYACPIKLYPNGTGKQILSGQFLASYYDGREPSVDPIYARVSFYRFPNPTTVTNPGTCTVHWVKIEKGNKPTDWTPAPEDLATSSDLEDTNEYISGVDERVTVSESQIDQLSDSISMMVTDKNGQSLMQQTSSGWTFNIGAIQSQIDEATSGLDTVEKNLASTTSLVNKANDLLDDVTEKTAYINMATDDDGSPCIELGKSGNPFKLRITNTSIDFMQDDMRIAYISNRQLYIEKSVVTDEMKIGSTSGFIWKKRDNGNMGLRWEDE